jgi:UDP-galactopyranose mutase
LHSQCILVIGAGLSGATAARVLAESGFAVVVAEAERHPGGHCHTYRDAETGIMVHAHGPHILHSDHPEVWAFIERFARLIPYQHTVRAVAGGQTYPLPITLTTLRQFFGRDFTPAEAQAHLAAAGRTYPQAPANFEEQGRALLGDALYEAFFDGYTRKQWGVAPSRLPASIMRRIPVRFSDNLSYYHHSRVAIPEQGYTAMIAAMLEHPAISVRYGMVAGQELAGRFLHTVYTGPLDAWFGHRLGHLQYRTLDFEACRENGTFQDVAQVNYCDLSVPWTRITEYKHFTTWERHDWFCAGEEPRVRARRHPLLSAASRRRRAAGRPLPRPGACELRRELRGPPGHVPVPRHGCCRCGGARGGTGRCASPPGRGHAAGAAR